jgi:hypothetical protein
MPHSLERRRVRMDAGADAGVDVSRLRRRTDPRIRESEPYFGYFFISEGWVMTAPALAVAYLLAGLAQYHLPGRAVVAMGLAALVLCALARVFVAYERTSRRSLALRAGAMVLGVVLPMGCLAARWRCGSMPAGCTPLALPGAMLVVGTVVSVVLSGRLLSMVGALAALWGPMAIGSMQPPRSWPMALAW